ncbi:hypothetical protein CALCODRAFT_500741 [Calocera cornea HHB12733]|uniref:F-box domain-containing protein n=1 Tax=Calocera cornea HHB12733 TaxID=1353952 RepID=A0A165DY98_9BASI|nr:hypothetical protein CALCODRAFT_500741 [Calocera cornea HHB12733]
MDASTLNISSLNISSPTISNPATLSPTASSTQTRRRDWRHRYTSGERKLAFEMYKVGREAFSLRQRYIVKKRQVETIFHRLNALRSQHAPINGLPVEVLLRIFNHAKDDLPNPNGFQYHIALVCKRWRQLILEDPVMWSSFTCRTNDDLLRAHPLIKESAKNAKLSLELEGCWCHMSAPIYPGWIAGFLAAHLGKIRRFDIQACNLVLYHLATVSLLDGSPIQDISFRIANCGAMCDSSIGRPIIRRWEALRCMYIDLEKPRVVRVVAPNLEQLTINARRSSVADIFETIRDCNSVSDLTLTMSDDVFFSYWVEDSEQKTLPLPNLTRLRLQDVPLTVWEKTRLFVMPKLESLTVVADERNAYQANPPFHIVFLFLLHCHKTLKEVFIDIDNLDLKGLIMRMQRLDDKLILPNLEVFGIRSQSPDGAHARLEWLGVQEDYAFDAELCNELVKLARVRTSNSPLVARLRAVSLVPPPTAEENARFTELGVEVDHIAPAQRRLLSPLMYESYSLSLSLLVHYVTKLHIHVAQVHQCRAGTVRSFDHHVQRPANRHSYYEAVVIIESHTSPIPGRTTPGPRCRRWSFEVVMSPCLRHRHCRR